MKIAFVISLLILFTNFTVSPILFTNAFLGKVTEERVDTSEEGNSLEEETEIKTFCQFNIAFDLQLSLENILFKSSEAKLLSVFLERSIQPPDQLI